jgi:hypothetical protein
MQMSDMVPAQTKKSDSGGRKFLEVVMIEEFLLWPAIGITSDSASIFPVPWKPVFGPLIDFCT